MQNYFLHISDVLTKCVVVCAENIDEAMDFANTANIELDDRQDFFSRDVDRVCAGTTGEASQIDVELYGVINVNDFKEKETIN